MLNSVKIRVIFGVQFERRTIDKKQTYTKTETRKLYSRVFCTWCVWFRAISFQSLRVFWDTVYAEVVILLVTVFIQLPH